VLTQLMRCVTTMDKRLITKYISASLLGDGCLRTWNRCQNYAYSFKQVDRHESYVKFLESVIHEITGCSIRHYGPSEKDGINRQGYFCLESKVHPFFTTLYSRWYVDGRKTISLHDLKQFDFEMLAMWYMEDGYILNSQNKYHNGNVFLCTDCFSEAEVKILQTIIYKSVDIAMDVIQRGYRKDGSRIYRLKAKNNQAIKFIKGVEPFIFDSYKYKLRTIDSFKDDDIV